MYVIVDHLDAANASCKLHAVLHGVVYESDNHICIISYRDNQIFYQLFTRYIDEI